MKDDSAEILFQSFLHEALVGSSGIGRDVHSLMSIQYCLGQLWHRPPFKVPWRIVLEACKFLSLDSCQKRFLCTHREIDLAVHSVVGLVLRVGDTEKFSDAPGFESLDPSFRVSKQSSPCFTAIEEVGGDNRLVELELACWWCHTRSCLVWPLLPLLRQPWCGLLLSRCHLCTGLLPDIWNWSPRLTSGRSCWYLHWCCSCCCRWCHLL